MISFRGISTFFSLDTYMSHEGILYCKPHHKELFLPKAARNDAFDVETMSKTQEAIMKHQEQQRKHETIIRESNPVELEGVVKCSTNDKYSGLENLDVGSKFKMFEQTEDDERGPSSDRYGIMEKLKRMQEGADIEDLLAELDEELPSDENEEEEEDEDDYGLKEVQKKVNFAACDIFIMHLITRKKSSFHSTLCSLLFLSKKVTFTSKLKFQK